MARVGNKMWLGTSEGIQIRNESTGDLIWEILDSPCYRCAVVDNEIWIGDQVGDVHIYNTEVPPILSSPCDWVVCSLG